MPLDPLLLLLLSLLVEVVAPPSVRAETAAQEVVVEIEAAADRLLDARLTRRLISLELREVDIPANPTIAANDRRSIFVRVLGDAGDRLRVELWEYGTFYGRRTITATPGGSRYLRAQRIALVAAELARRLRQERLRQLREQAQARQTSAHPSPESKTSLAASRISLYVAGRATAIGPGQLYLAGPSMGAALTVLGRGSLELGAAWLFGSAATLPESPRVEWLEFSVAPSYGLVLGRGWEMHPGVRAAAASLRFTRVAAVDRISGECDTWSARAVGELKFDYGVATGARLRAGPELGALLRRIPVVDRTGTDRWIGGLWLGLAAGVILDPRHF